MNRSHSAPVHRAPRSIRTLVSALLAFLLLVGLAPFSAGAPPQAEAAPPSSPVNVLLHFKDAQGETVDFTSYEASAVRQGDTLLIAVGDGSAALDFRDNLRFAVYDRYAAFNNQQQDITGDCFYDEEAGIVSVPARFEERLGELAIVFWLSPAHAAYDRFITSQLITDAVQLEYEGRQTTMASDIKALKAAAEA